MQGHDQTRSVAPLQWQERVDEPVVAVHDVGLLEVQHAAELPGRFRVDGGRSVRPRRVGVPPEEAGRRALDPVHGNRGDLAHLRQVALLERDYGHVMATGDQFAAQILDDAFLPSDDRRVELRHHQDAHAVSLRTAS